MKIKLLTAVLLAASGLLAACGKQTAETPAAPAPEEQTPESGPAAENIPLEMDPVFRSTNAKISREEMEALGFEFGDSLTLSFSTGLVLDDIPYHDGYYVKPGNPVAVSYPGLPDLNIALNLGDGSWDVYGFQEGDTVSVRLKEKGRYLNEQKTFAQSHSDDINDYESAETFANFRSLSGGEVAPDLIYRSATMTNNSMNRADVVDDLSEQYGIKTVLDYSDTEESLAGFRAMDSWNSDYFDALYEKGSAHVLGLGVNPASEEFHKDLSQALYGMILEEGPYLFFCTEGKDRTGYCAALIEALCGATYDEMLADYMLTYENYYGMTKESAPEQCRAAIDTSFDPIMRIMFEVNDDEDLAAASYEERARQFLREGGLTDAQIDEMHRVFTGAR